MDVFKTTTPWCRFSNIVGKAAGIDNVAADGEAIDYTSPYKVYGINGICVGTAIEGLAPGFYIIKQGRKVEKIKIQ